MFILVDPSRGLVRVYCLYVCMFVVFLRSRFIFEGSEPEPEIGRLRNSVYKSKKSTLNRLSLKCYKRKSSINQKLVEYKYSPIICSIVFIISSTVYHVRFLAIITVKTHSSKTLNTF